jgi:hypothetical protein
MLLVEIPWASRVWALPFLSALAPSERYAAKQGKRHKKITEWAWQLLLQIRRWYPEREIVVVADGAYASLKLLNRCRSLSRPVAFITRLRLDAALYEPAPPRRPGQIGRPRKKGERVSNLSVVAEKIPLRSGSPLRSLSGMEKGSVRSRSLHRRPCGTPRACSPYPCAGSFSETRKESSLPRLSCVPTLKLTRRRVCYALAAGSNLPGGTKTSRAPDPKAVLGFGDSQNHTGSVGSVLAGHFVCASPYDETGGRCFPAGSLVPQATSDLCRCACVGAKGAVG